MILPPISRIVKDYIFPHSRVPMGKYTLRDVEFEIDVPLDVDPRRKFDISADSFAELKQAGQELQQQIADEFGVRIESVKLKRDRLKGNKFLIF